MTIPEIKARLPLGQVLSHYGWTPDGRGRMRCPFHDDATPSMQVYTETGTVYCFAGACRTAGRSLDVIDVVMEAERCTKHEAITRAASMAGALPKATAAVATVAKATNREVAGDAARAAVLGKAWATMRTGLRHSTAAQDYLRGRGLDYKALGAAGACVGYNSGQAHTGGRMAAALVASWCSLPLLRTVLG